ncbi:hypothetical protein CEG14_22115 [Bordetella genomosp. 1]|uniref:Uncharacterized protein n=1 Tax=Bordetella genomosp. 1 TaxID=1395607 RepID=A0A261RYF7_9BORD|nr:hypothetical protein [Bordetella genomosp. 1]MDQ8033635.1 hypothetical protein [Bordetella sp.]OZI29313.1 hypothetical protein CEG14_22115 [Bordetella genomosp. 1]OZI64958.1 hypothetical protein CAL27_07700 [Bordetella genomosp. 1]
MTAATPPLSQDEDDPGALNTPIVMLGLQLLCLRPVMDILYGNRLFDVLDDGSPPHMLRDAAIYLLAALCVLNILGGVLLFMARRPGTLKLMYIAIWGGGPIGGVALLTMMLAFDDLSASEVLQASTPGTLMASMLAATLWTVYLTLAGYAKVRYGVTPSFAARFAPR